MQINYIMSEAEALELVREALAERLPHNSRIGTVEISQKEVYPDLLSMNRKEVAEQNKIWLIKMIRDLSTDIFNNHIRFNENDVIGLGDAKNWVERYIITNSTR